MSRLPLKPRPTKRPIEPDSALSRDGEPQPERGGRSNRIFLLLIVVLIGAVQLMNYNVYRATSRSGEVTNIAGNKLSELAGLQRDGFLWSQSYRHFDEPGGLQTVQFRQQSFRTRYQRITSDPDTNQDVRNDLNAIGNFLPDIEKLTAELIAAPASRDGELLEIIHPAMEQLTDRTRRLFEREEKIYFEQVQAIAKDNKNAQRNLLIGSAISGVTGLVMLALVIRRARTDLEKAYQALLVEVHEREATEVALRESEERYRLVLSSVKEVVFQCDISGRWTALTPAWIDLTGRSIEESLGLTLVDITYPEDQEKAASLVSFEDATTDVVERFEVRIVANDDAIKWAEVRFQVVASHGNAPARVVGTLQDVTDRQELEFQLRQAQRLESVGHLAAGVAHEINTPIQFIGDNARFIKDATASVLGVLDTYKNFFDSTGSLPENIRQAEQDADIDFLHEELSLANNELLDGVDRVTTLVQAMKAFGHPGGDSASPVDVNECLRNTLVVAQAEYKDVADLEEHYGEIPIIEGIANALNQVFLNIIVNAAHAMSDVMVKTSQRGLLRVETRAEEGAVLIAITDTGEGIPKNIQGSIFDPFFTTKSVGKGTGQGLAIARSIAVDKHGGELFFESEEGVGTTFFIRLPSTGLTTA